jgi:hypothetical protein
MLDNSEISHFILILLPYEQSIFTDNNTSPNYTVSAYCNEVEADSILIGAPTTFLLMEIVLVSSYTFG